MAGWEDEKLGGALSAEDFEFYDEVLTFLEGAYAAPGEYLEGKADEETARDVLLLNFTKVVNDCRAILKLAKNGFWMQGAIVVRSTIDACNVMMHVAFEGEDSGIVERWLGGERLTHWVVVRELNRVLRSEGKLDLRAYAWTRRRLDDMVHGNYSSVRLYPAQAPGPTPLSAASLTRLTLWTPLLDLCIVSCLVAAELIMPEGAEAAQAYLQAVIERTGPGQRTEGMGKRPRSGRER